MVYFPEEIIKNILGRLTIEAALPAKQVCKSWRIFLRTKTDKIGLLFVESYLKEEKNKLYYGDQYDPLLEKMNYNYSSCDRLDKVLGKSIPGYTYMNNLLGSCNGLVCIASRYPNFEKPFLICNPITGEVVYIPHPDTSIAQDCDPSKICGFGYCHSTNEYKIVRMHQQTPRMSHVLVYTVGGGAWRSKGSIHIPLSDSITTPLDSAAAGTYASGALYWLFRTTNEERKDYKIVAFDLEDEKFEFIHLTHFEELRYIHSPKLLGGNNLYLLDTSQHCTQIWAYKKTNYNDKKSWRWIKEFRIYCKDAMYYEPLAITRNKELILRSQDYRGVSLYCYDLRTLTMNKLLDGRASGCNMVNVIPHANSIVSILPVNDEEVQDR
ncbi:F-box protein At5g49610-like [Papaver somniferum]|uniref:F-box protein At5g49610-like n=1 Tax=Papaver somniferum TaxID=3469 RepID=UPI000E7054DC|nr:F-box protein At5g49610-like [Papaver somniferum]